MCVHAMLVADHSDTADRTTEPFPLELAALDAPGRNRTCDLVLRRHALYPLSYGREGAS